MDTPEERRRLTIFCVCGGLIKFYLHDFVLETLCMGFQTGNTWLCTCVKRGVKVWFTDWPHGKCDEKNILEDQEDVCQYPWVQMCSRKVGGKVRHEPDHENLSVI